MSNASLLVETIMSNASLLVHATDQNSYSMLIHITGGGKGPGGGEGRLLYFLPGCVVTGFNNLPIIVQAYFVRINPYW